MSEVNDQYQLLLEKMISELKKKYHDQFKGCLLFGSTVRQLKPSTDIDLLVIVDGLPQDRSEKMHQFDSIEAACKTQLSAVEKLGIHLIFSAHLKSTKSVQNYHHFYLDLPECHRILYDPYQILEKLLDKIREWRISSGAKRINKGQLWYWDLSGGLPIDPEKKLGW